MVLLLLVRRLPLSRPMLESAALLRLKPHHASAAEDEENDGDDEEDEEDGD